MPGTDQFRDIQTQHARFLIPVESVGPHRGALSATHGNIMIPPKIWAEKIYNVVQWNEYDGGHFAAMEKPEVLAEDIVNFISKLIK